jgi:hypothetical protein
MFQGFLEGLTEEVHDREHHNIRSIEDYITLRSLTIGMNAPYVMLELGFDLPDEVYCHPVVVELKRLATEMVFLDNVQYSLHLKHIPGELTYFFTTSLGFIFL